MTKWLDRELTAWDVLVLGMIGTLLVLVAAFILPTAY